jgi:putative lipoprotein
MKSRFSKIVAAAALGSVIFTTGCASNKPPEPMSTISVTATSRQPVSFSPNAVAYLRLADVTNGHARSTTLLQKEVRPEGLPIGFTLSYNEKWIKPSHQYAVDVRVVDHGQLLLLSDANHHVITDGHPNTVSMMLDTPGKH